MGMIYRGTSQEGLSDRGAGVGKALIFLGVAAALTVLLADIGFGQAPRAVSIHGLGQLVVPTVHSPIAMIFAILGSSAITSGLALGYVRPIRSVRALSFIGGLALLYVDGVLHWLAVLEHVSEPSSAAFFTFAGGVQVLAVPLVLRREKLLWWVGVPLTVFFIELYFVTRIVPPPFSFGPESLESLGVLSKAIEIGLLVTLGVFFGPRMVPLSLRRALASARSVYLVLLGALASLMTIDVEVDWYWWILTRTAFVLTAFLVIGLVVSAGLAYYLHDVVLVGLTWSFALMLMILHVLFAVDYARWDLALPLVFCIGSGVLLTTSVLTYGRPKIVPLRGMTINLAPAKS